MAYDKCTLLSSQGSDAPALLTSQPGPQGNFSSLPRANHAVKTRSALIRSRRSATRTTGEAPILAGGNPPHKATGVQMGFCSPLEGARPSGPPLYPLGRTTRTLRGPRGPHKSGPHPGRVTPHRARRRCPRGSLRVADPRRVLRRRRRVRRTPAVAVRPRDGS